MPQIAPPSPQSNQVPLSSKYFREWEGCYLHSARNAMPDDRWFYLENLIPIGSANVRSVPNISAALQDYGVDTVYWSQYVNLSGVDYLIQLCTNGKVFAYNLAGGNSQINTALTLLSGSGSRLAQWKNTIILFIDSTGYYSYDGATFAKITGAGVPTAGNDIAVYAGRVWIVNGRLLTVSAVDDYTAAAFLAANGAATVNLTDPTLRSTVTRLWAQNGYLYIFGNSSINAISDVYVPSGASPPTPIFTNLNIQSIIGTDQPASVFAMDRMMMFATRYGVYSLLGVSAPRLSEDIDDTWQYIDFSQQISGGQVVVSNLLHSAFLIKRSNDPVLGSATVLAMYANKKWWFANFGALTFATFALKNNAPALFGFIGNKLFQLFFDTASAPNGKALSPLWPMEDPLANKNVTRAGFEVTVTTAGANPFTMTLDSVNNQSTVVTLSSPSLISWVNNSNQIVLWQNNALAIVGWFSGAYLLYFGDAQGGWQKYVGLTVNTGGAVCQLSGMFMDYKLGARWAGK